MTTKKKLMVAVLMSLAALWLASSGKIVAGDGDTPLDHPFRIHGDATVLADWENQSIDSDGRPFVPWTMTASQVSTEGWSTNKGSGVIYLDTFVSEGSGVSVEVNGDTTTWDSVEEVGTQHVAITITGGTGQFENASGEFTLDYTILASELNEEGNPIKLTYTYWGAGSITY